MLDGVAVAATGPKPGRSKQRPYHAVVGRQGGALRTQAKMPVPLNLQSELYLLCFQQAHAMKTFSDLTRMLQ